MNKKRKRELLIVVGSLLGCSCVALGLVLPILFGKDEDVLVDSSSLGGLEDKVKGIGDEQGESEPYLYEHFIPPAHSFGMGETVFKRVNESFFWSFFENNSNWKLEYTSKLGNPWEDVTSSDLDIDYIVNDSSISQKMILNFTASSTGYYRLNFTINESCSDYYFDGVSEYGLNVTIPSNSSGEVYNVKFNWSDVIHSSWHQYIVYNHGLVDGKFFFSVDITSKISKGNSISIDPNFGYDDALNNNVGIVFNGVAWCRGQPGTVESDGVVDNLSFYYWCDSNNLEAGDYAYIVLSLYEYIDGDTDYAGNIIANTTSMTLTRNTADTTWYTLDFVEDPNPTVESGESYYIVMTITEENLGTGESFYIGTRYFGGDYFYVAEAHTGLENPWEGESKSAGSVVGAYGSYTESGGPSEEWIERFDYWFTGGNISNFVERNDTWYTGGNVTVDWIEQYDYYFIGGNISSDKEQYNYWFTGGNISDYEQQYDYWYTGGNVTVNWIEQYNYWFTGGNITLNWDEQFNYWFTGGNVSSDIERFDYWFTGGNTSVGGWTERFDYYFIGGNISDYEEQFDYYFIGGNLSNMNEQFDYWFTGGNISDIVERFDYYFTGGNISESTERFNYWFTGGNTSVEQVWTERFDYWFTGGNVTGYIELFDYWFTGGNTSEDMIIISNVYPGNSSTGIGLQPVLCGTINSTLGNIMNISWYYGNSLGSCNTLLGSDTNIVNSTQTELHYNATEFITVYYWRASVNDGEGNYLNETFSFTTERQGGGILAMPNNYYLVFAVIGLLGIFGIMGLIKRKRTYRR